MPADKDLGTGGDDAFNTFFSETGAGKHGERREKGGGGGKERPRRAFSSFSRLVLSAPLGSVCRFLAAGFCFWGVADLAAM